MIDPTTEQLIDLAEVCRICGTNGRPLHPSTAWRWVFDGRGPDRVRLETVRIGGRTRTSRQALQRFLAALNPEPTIAPSPVRTPAARRRAADRAGRELEAKYDLK